MVTGLNKYFYPIRLQIIVYSNNSRSKDNTFLRGKFSKTFLPPKNSHMPKTMG